MSRARVFLSVAIIILAPGAAAAQTAHSRSAEQTHFSAEDAAVRHPASIPDGILGILKQETIAKGDVIPPGDVVRSWFSASLIHLADLDEKDYIVEAEGEQKGANVAMFWVFVPSARGYKLVLSAPALDLEVKMRRSKGHRDIELTSATAVVVTIGLFRWNGTLYAKDREQSHEIR